MANRFLITFGDDFMALNNHKDILRFNTNKPRKIGDDATIIIKADVLCEERQVRYLKSNGHVKDGTYLCDLEHKECWAYNM